MKIYSTRLTRNEILDALRGIDGVCVDDSGVREFAPRRGGNGFELYLEGYGERHFRARNGRGGHAATWDDYGVWMDRLFKIDPDAEISFWKGQADFLAGTARYAPNLRARAPWLKGAVPHWPDAEQNAVDAAKIERKRKREIREEARRLQARADRLLETL